MSGARESRQVTRRKLCYLSFHKISAEYPGELRKYRRRMARKLAYRTYRELGRS